MSRDEASEKRRVRRWWWMRPKSRRGQLTDQCRGLPSRPSTSTIHRPDNPSPRPDRPGCAQIMRPQTMESICRLARSCPIVSMCASSGGDERGRSSSPIDPLPCLFDGLVPAVHDSHAHPTTSTPPNSIIDELARVRVGSICAMSTHEGDQELVKELAQGSQGRVTPCFGATARFSARVGRREAHLT